MKKALVATAFVLLGLVIIAQTSVAANLVEDITAQINQNVIIMWDKEIFVATDASGNIIKPIIYNNTVYVPLRAFGVESGHAVAWDPDTSTVSVSSPASLAADEEPASTEPPAEVSSQQPAEQTYSAEFSEPRSITLDGEITSWQYWMRFGNVYMEYHDALALLRYCCNSRIYVLNYNPTSKVFVLNEDSMSVQYFMVDGYKVINVSSIDNGYNRFEVNLDIETGEISSL